MILDKKGTIPSYQDKQGKHGRYLANIVLEDGLEVNQWLIDKGHAKPYFLKKSDSF